MVAKSTVLNAVTNDTEARPRAEVVVFWIVRDSACEDCGEALGRGRFLRMEAGRPLCLACADLDHLVFLERGDAALTRRATRYSTVRAVVVRFSRSRKRYERQGVLVEEQALARAERECLSDVEARRLARGARHRTPAGTGCGIRSGVRAPHRGTVSGLSGRRATSGCRTCLPEILWPDRPFGGGQRARGDGCRFGRARSHSARAHRLRRTSGPRRPASRGSRDGVGGRGAATDPLAAGVRNAVGERGRRAAGR